MHRLHEGRLWKFVALYVAATLMVPYAVVSFPAVAQAQAQPVVESAAVIVLPIVAPDDSLVVSQKATDALALAMEASGEFMVTSEIDLQRELDELEMTPPLSVAEQVRLGERLQVDQVATGEITDLRVNQNTGQVSISLSVAMLDVSTGEFLNGANVSTVTKPVPGFEGEQAGVINNAVREIAEEAVAEILSSRIPQGFVTSVNQFGVATVNLGHDDRLQSGMELLLLRPTWQKDMEKLIMVKVGRFSVSDVGARTSKLLPLTEGRARVGDRAFKLYRGPERVEAYKRKESHRHTLTVLAALGLLFGVVEVATGPASDDAPVGVTSHLFQHAPGDEAVIRIHVPDRPIPLDEQVFAWLFFRADGQQNFSLSPANLVGFVDESRLPNNVWDDHSAFAGDIEVEMEFDYITGDGDEETIDVDLLYHHWSLDPGHTYYHRVQRIVEPVERAGSGAPIATAGLSPAQLEPPTISIEPGDAQSDGSAPTDGVTYFTPPVLQSPENGAQNQSTSSITFTWNSTLGANEYILQVFPQDDPNGQRVPVYQVELRQDTSGTMFTTIDTGFNSEARYYWRVGARRSGEARPVCYDREGWLFSEIRTFLTAQAPPPPPGTTAAGHRPGGSVYTGTFGMSRYMHRVPGARSEGLK